MRDNVRFDAVTQILQYDCRAVHEFSGHFEKAHPMIRIRDFPHAFQHHGESIDYDPHLRHCLSESTLCHDGICPRKRSFREHVPAIAEVTKNDVLLSVNFRDL